MTGTGTGAIVILRNYVRPAIKAPSHHCRYCIAEFSRTAAVPARYILIRSAISGSLHMHCLHPLAYRRNADVKRRFGTYLAEHLALPL